MPETSLKRNAVNGFVKGEFLEIFVTSIFQNNSEQMFLNLKETLKTMTKCDLRRIHPY